METRQNESAFACSTIAPKIPNSHIPAVAKASEAAEVAREGHHAAAGDKQADREPDNRADLRSANARVAIARKIVQGGVAGHAEMRLAKIFAGIWKAVGCPKN